MSGPDRIFKHKDWLFTHGPASDPALATQDYIEFVRRDPAVLAAIPEVQAIVDAAVAAEREACAWLATSFLVGDPRNGIPLRFPSGVEVAAAIRKRGEG